MRVQHRSGHKNIKGWVNENLIRGEKKIDSLQNLIESLYLEEEERILNEEEEEKKA